MPGARRYHIHEPVGRGAFGTVYRATLAGEGGFQKDVAIKILNDKASGNESIVSRLRDEARLLGRVRHRAILQVDGLIHAGTRWALVAEYIRGASLHDVFRTDRVPVGVVAEIIGEVAGALHSAYSTVNADGQMLKLVHRDIKPANIQITTAGEVKLLDFGIARADFEERESDTQALVLGTPGYMSPERFDGGTGPEGDIYALGVVACELITGKRVGKTFAAPGKHLEHICKALAEADQVPEFAALRELVAEMVDYDGAERPYARDVERRCRQIRAQLPAPYLAEWSETVIAALVAAKPPVTDESTMSGVTIAEGTGESLPTQEMPHEASPLDTPTASETPAPVHRSSGPARFVPSLGLLVGLGAVAASFLLVATGLGAVVAWQGGLLGGAPDSGSAVAAVAAPDVAPAPIVPAVVVAPVEDAPPTVPAPSEVAPPPLEVAPAAPASVPSRDAASVAAPVAGGIAKGAEVVPAEVVPVAVVAEVVAPPPAAPAPPAGPIVTAAEFAKWLGEHPEWLPEAALADGRVDETYLWGWSGTVPPEPSAPAMSVAWGAAAAMCKSRGGLPALTAEPATWSDADGVVQEWRVNEGKAAWQRYDGVSSKAVRRVESNPFTAFRCAR